MTYEQILDELKPYGMDRIADDSRDYPLDDYYPVKFILHYLHRPECLPKLAELLDTCSDADLVHGQSNALMWAGGRLACEKLSLLEGRKDFIARHIHDRGRGGMTAMHYMVRFGGDDAKAIRLLAAWGADVNAADDHLWTPLHEAARCNQNNDRSWSALVSLGALSSRNSAGDTPEDLQNWLDALDAW